MLIYLFAVDKNYQTEQLFHTGKMLFPRGTNLYQPDFAIDAASCRATMIEISTSEKEGKIMERGGKKKNIFHPRDETNRP